MIDDMEDIKRITAGAPAGESHHRLQHEELSDGHLISIV